MLPDGDGRDVLPRAAPHLEVPMIMLTARGTETDRVVGLELGADDYVVKPFSGAEVIARLRAVLRRTRRRRPPPAAAPPRGDRRRRRSPSSSAPAGCSSTARSSRSAARSSTCWPT